ncbi:hypothetical protein PoMZ_07249 [Pyricularia oryzae]|uniref:MYB DNA-binding domain-containing protein n=1 Tax=Pyricularia oryzae TaxID=318829 RepID=A0A4P7NEL8_PYROR|nr:hypothetical protein PoMZ_07249 [Pyricularia oryzae]
MTSLLLSGLSPLVRELPIASPVCKGRRDTANVDIASLLKGSDSNESSAARPHQAQSTSESPPTAPTATTTSGPPSYYSSYTPNITPPSTLTPPQYTTSAFGPGPGPSYAPPPPLLGPGPGPVTGPVPGTSFAPAPSYGPAGTPGFTQGLTAGPGSGAVGPPQARRTMAPHMAEGPQAAKKQSKWTPEEDAIIIELRGSGMKWDEISKRLPGRSSISCRLHYQNYLERRSEWDEERKNKLARLYERLKAEMWAKLAEEMQVPWRAAEAMHWQIGEHEMARRAGTTPFSLSGSSVENPHHRASPSRGHHHHAHSQTSVPRDFYGGRGTPGMPTHLPPGRSLVTRPQSQHELGDPGMMYGSAPPPRHNLAPIHTETLPPPTAGRGGGMLPGVSELTTGVSPYSTPAYSMGMPGTSPVHSQTASPGPFLSTPSSYQLMDPSGVKRRASPGYGPEASRRRQYDPRSDDSELASRRMM